jgi:hypothetical protein
MAKPKKKWGRTAQTYEVHIENIVEDYVNGATMKAIGERYGISGPTVKRWLKELGYIHDRTGRYPAAMKARAKVLYEEQGWDVIAISNLLKVKPEFVLAWTGQAGRAPAGRTGKAVATGAAGRLTRPQEAPIEDQRHTRGKWWREYHKRQVLFLLTSGNLKSVAQIYWATGASRRRQNMIWREYVGDTMPFPFPKKRRVSRAEGRIGVAEFRAEQAELESLNTLEYLRREIGELEDSDDAGELIAKEILEEALEAVEGAAGLAGGQPPPSGPRIDPATGTPFSGSPDIIDPESISLRLDELEERRLLTEADYQAEEDKLRRLRRIMAMNADDFVDPQDAITAADPGSIKLVEKPVPTISEDDIRFGLDELDRRKRRGLPMKNPKSSAAGKKSAKKGSTKGRKRATKKSSTSRTKKKPAKRTSAKRKP